MMDEEFYLLAKPNFKLLLTKLEVIHSDLRDLKNKKYDLSKVWLTNKEVQQILGISGRQLANLRAKGKIGYSQESPGAKIYFSAKDVNDYFKRNYQPPFDP